MVVSIRSIKLADRARFNSRSDFNFDGPIRKVSEGGQSLRLSRILKLICKMRRLYPHDPLLDQWPVMLEFEVGRELLCPAVISATSRAHDNFVRVPDQRQLGSLV